MNNYSLRIENNSLNPILTVRSDGYIMVGTEGFWPVNITRKNKIDSIMKEQDKNLSDIKYFRDMILKSSKIPHNYFSQREIKRMNKIKSLLK